jgi:hypothetical protein
MGRWPWLGRIADRCVWRKHGCSSYEIGDWAREKWPGVHPSPHGSNLRKDVVEGSAEWTSQVEGEVRSCAVDVPIMRRTDPMEVANVVALLASDEASFVTGSAEAATDVVLPNQVLPPEEDSQLWRWLRSAISP